MLLPTKIKQSKSKRKKLSEKGSYYLITVKTLYRKIVVKPATIKTRTSLTSSNGNGANRYTWYLHEIHRQSEHQIKKQNRWLCTEEK